MNPILAVLLKAAAKAGEKVARLKAARKILDSIKRKPVTALAVVAIAGATPGCALWKNVDDCGKLRIAEQLACPVAPESPECKEARERLAAVCGAVRPPAQPPVEPPVQPPVTPPPVTPPPVTPPPVTPPPVQPPTDEWSVCPKKPAEGATVWVRAKPYGQGVDTEVNVRGDADFCFAIHGVSVTNCHLEGWSQRQACEQQLVKAYGDGGLCPVFQWRTAQRPEVHDCIQVDPYETGGMSCDHFGNTVDRDDPNTAFFEGQPAVCALQRDDAGHPRAGYFAIAHGDGEVRACLPGGSGCSNGWVRVVH